MQKTNYPLLRSLVLAAACVASVQVPVQASLSAKVAFVDDVGALTPWYDDVASHVNAALAEWGKVVLGDAELDVEIKVTHNVPRSAASSTSSAFVRYQNGLSIYAPGAIKKVNDGIDVNGTAADVEILINPFYLTSELWFDPDPFVRQALMPSNKTDAMSVFMHEIGHALGYNGWGNSFDGGLPASYASTWDLLTEFDGGSLYFVGPNAQLAYGGRVPITMGNNYHIGNSHGAGDDLLEDVMNGVVFYRGFRYEISPLNVAMLKDMGVAVQAVPEPESIAMLMAGLLVVALGRQGLKRQQR